MMEKDHPSSEQNALLDTLRWGSHRDASLQYLLQKYHGRAKRPSGPSGSSVTLMSTGTAEKYFHFYAFLEKIQESMS